MAKTMKTEQRLALEAEVWQLRRRGKSMETIARELSVSSQTVHAVLKRVGQAVAKQLASTVEAMKAEQTQQYDHLHEEAMSAWERSQQNAETNRTVTKKLGAKNGAKQSPGTPPDDTDAEDIPGLYMNEAGEETTAEERARLIAEHAVEKAEREGGVPLTVIEEVTTAESKGQAGDPRFLTAAMAALDAKRAIWGLDAPKPDSGTVPVVVKVYQGVNMEDEV